MAGNNATFLVVTEDGKAVGMFTISDYLSNMSKYGDSLHKNPVGSMMSQISAIEPELNLFEANEYMAKKEFKKCPVIVNSTILGILNPEELLQNIFSYLHDQAENN